MYGNKVQTQMESRALSSDKQICARQPRVLLSKVRLRAAPQASARMLDVGMGVALIAVATISLLT